LRCGLLLLLLVLLVWWQAAFDAHNGPGMAFMLEVQGRLACHQDSSGRLLQASECIHRLAVNSSMSAAAAAAAAGCSCCRCCVVRSWAC
jgi:hypothetical protein